MNHPKPEEWAPFIYNEAGSDARKRLREHLRECAECRREVEAWQRTAGRLNAWRLPRRASLPGEWVQPLLKWAVAGCCAGLMLLAGFALGRSTAPDKLQTQLRQQMREEFAAVLRDELNRSNASTLAVSAEQTRALLARFAEGAEAKRAEDRDAVFAALDKVYFSLKKDLDTVAVFTDAGLRDTRRRIVQMADYAQPAGETSPQEN